MNENQICQHLSICVVTEMPTDGENVQAEKIFVECSDCFKILPIQTVTQETRVVPLTLTNEQT